MSIRLKLLLLLASLGLAALALLATHCEGYPDCGHVEGAECPTSACVILPLPSNGSPLICGGGSGGGGGGGGGGGEPPPTGELLMACGLSGYCRGATVYYVTPAEDYDVRGWSASTGQWFPHIATASIRGTSIQHPGEIFAQDICEYQWPALPGYCSTQWLGVCQHHQYGCISPNDPEFGWDWYATTLHVWSTYGDPPHVDLGYSATTTRANRDNEQCWTSMQCFY